MRQKQQLEKQSGILHHITEASEAIRRKHRAIKLGKEAAERAVSESLKPVVTPLEKLVSQATVQHLSDKQQKKKRIKKAKQRPVIPFMQQQYQPQHFDNSEEADDDDDSDALYATASDPKIDNYHSKLFSSTPAHLLAKPSTSFSRVSFNPTLHDDHDDDDEASYVEEQKLKKSVGKDQIIESIDVTSGINPVSPSLSSSIRADRSLLQVYLNKLGTAREKDLDIEYGVRKLRNGLKIGNAPVTFEGNTIIIKDEKYNLTPGLMELIFKKSPESRAVTTIDKKNYVNIIRQTDAHRKNYKKDHSIRKSKSSKYKDLIVPLLLSSSSSSNAMKTGSSLLPQYMIAPQTMNNHIDYIYWDDPNELVDRLRLLMASQTAGNSSHTNEIISIIEELREAGIIY